MERSLVIGVLLVVAGVLAAVGVLVVAFAVAFFILLTIQDYFTPFGF